MSDTAAAVYRVKDPDNMTAVTPEKRDPEKPTTKGEDEEDEVDDAWSAMNCGCLEKASDVVSHAIESVFYNIGHFNGRHPWAAILIGLGFAILCTLGNAFWYEEVDPAKLWVPGNSRAVKDKDRGNEWFPTLARVAEVIVYDSENMLTSEKLSLALELRDSIVGITVGGKDWDEICFRTGPNCFEQNLLEAWSYNETTISGLSDAQIVTDINVDPLYSPVTGKEIDVPGLLGDYDNSTGQITSAKAIRMTYYIKTTDLNDPSKDELDWEKEFLDICGRGVDGVRLYYFAVRSYEDEGGSAIEDDVNLLAAGYILVLIFLAVSLGKFNLLEQKIYMALTAFLVIALGIAISFGLGSLFQFDYTPLHSVLPFLLLGIGVDDMFVFVAAWDNLTPDEVLLPIPEKIALMTKHAGVSILITSLTDVVAFGIGATTIIPALRSFCFFSAMGILGIFTMTIFVFTGIFTYERRRAAARRDACCCCIKLDSCFSPSYEPNNCSQREMARTVFDQGVAKVLAILPVKAVVLAITVIVFAFGLWGTIEFESDFDPDWFVPPGNYFKTYLKKSDDLYPDAGYLSYIYFGEIDYYEHLDELLELPGDFGAVEHVSASSISFYLTDWRQWCRDSTNATITSLLDGNRYPTSEDNFYFTVYEYIQGDGSDFSSDINFEEGSDRIESSRLSFNYEKMENSEERIKAMDDSRKVVDDLAGISKREAFVFTEEMLTWEGDKVIRVELFRNIALAFVAVLLVCIILLANVVTCLLVLSCVVFTLVDVAGMLHWWGVAINSVSCICLVIAIGLSVDYAAHLGHTFMISAGSRQTRMRRALRNIGPPVFNGGFSTFLAFLPLANAGSYVFQTFFQVFFLVSLFGLFHGLIFLPVMLSWVGPSPYLSVKKKQQGKGFGNPLEAQTPAISDEKKISQSRALPAGPPSYGQSVDETGKM